MHTIEEMCRTLVKEALLSATHGPPTGSGLGWQPEVLALRRPVGDVSIAADCRTGSGRVRAARPQGIAACPPSAALARQLQSRGFAKLQLVDEWEVRVTDEFLGWVDKLDPKSKGLVVDAIDRLAEAGPGLGRPLVDRLVSSEIHNLKELRPASAGSSEIRIIFVFDPWRSAILLVGGDKSGDWSGWYRKTIPQAEKLYVEYVKEREAEEGRL